ncbi:MAG: hypothetical protein OEY50_07700 [Nitrospinota bacterium]|nr:hypothetical protein [Nitrospinota bacterium]
MEGKKGPAFLWDKSNIWGVMAWRSFASMGVDIHLLTAEEIRRGALDGHSLLFVPGGWAAEKKEALGDEGVGAVCDFVARGGAYLGVCGGAGLGLEEPDGLGLAPVGRGKGLPNFSGPIRTIWKSHPDMDWTPGQIVAPVWWPGNFHIKNRGQVRVLAEYGAPEPGFMVADLVAEDVRRHGGFGEWEKEYGIELDPGRLQGAPCVVEADFGQGRVALSYLHLETPGFEEARRALLALMESMAGPLPSAAVPSTPDECATGNMAMGLLDLVEDFNQFGQSNFLWTRRNEWLIRWRRGIRGIEYCALMELAREVAYGSDNDIPGKYVERLAGFFGKAEKLLMAERMAMAQGSLELYKCVDSRLGAMRGELFGNKRRPGGEYVEILSETEALLLPLLKKGGRK